MTRANLSGRALRAALIAMAALCAFACGEVNITGPTAPDWSWSQAGTRSLQIYGTLEVQDGACFEATVLYDGVELAGARSSCAEPGCTRLQLRASTPSEAGHHTISFKVLRQSQAALDYVAHGNVLVNREGVGLGGVSMPLGPRRASLEAGDSVDFGIGFED